MTELFIDNQLVILPVDFKIKVIQDNPHFTKSSTYTRDIKLSLNSLQNRRVFKNINRVEVTKNVTHWPARLKCDNVLDIQGKAILREIKDDMISLQLVSDNSAMNFLGKRDAYIDEVKYNNTMAERLFFPIDTWHKYLTRDEILSLFGAQGQKNSSPWLPSKVWYVFNPLYNMATDTICNNFAAIAFPEGDLGYRTYWYSVYQPMAPQPYIVPALRLLFKKFGYTLEMPKHIEDLLYNVYIVNATPGDTLNAVFPHWTLNELLTQLEYLLNVTFILTGDILKMVPMATYYKEEADRTTLTILDAYSTTMNDDEKSDRSKGNVGYDLQSGTEPNRRLDRELKKNYRIVECSDYSDMEIKKNNLDAYERFHVFYRAFNRLFIYRRDKAGSPNGEFEQVDVFSDIIRDETDDESLELKIMPASMGIHPITLAWNVSGDNKLELPHPADVIMPELSGPLSTDDEKYIDLADVLDSGKGDNDKDTIQLAINNVEHDNIDFHILWNNKDGSSNFYGRYPTAFTDISQHSGDEKLVKKVNTSLRLLSDGRVKCIGDLHYSTRVFDTKLEYTFKFVSNKKMGVRDIFVVRNQEYVAKSIELEVRADGINPIQQAKMYKLEN